MGDKEKTPAQKKFLQAWNRRRLDEFTSVFKIRDPLSAQQVLAYLNSLDRNTRSITIKELKDYAGSNDPKKLKYVNQYLQSRADTEQPPAQGGASAQGGGASAQAQISQDQLEQIWASYRKQQLIRQIRSIQPRLKIQDLERFQISKLENSLRVLRERQARELQARAQRARAAQAQAQARAAQARAAQARDLENLKWRHQLQDRLRGLRGTPVPLRLQVKQEASGGQAPQQLQLPQAPTTAPLQLPQAPTTAPRASARTRNKVPIAVRR